VIGESDNGYGVYDLSKSRDGVVVGFSPHGSDVHSQSIDCHGMLGTSSRFGMHGVSIQDADVIGIDRMVASDCLQHRRYASTSI